MDLPALGDQDTESQGGKRATDCKQPTGPCGHELLCHYLAGLTRYDFTAHCCTEQRWERDSWAPVHHDAHPRCLTHTLTDTSVALFLPNLLNMSSISLGGPEAGI